MGLISLPVIAFLYWLMLHYKKDAPFPKGGVLCLIPAGAVSALLASLIYTPVSSFASMIYGAGKDKTSFQWNLLNMFLTAGLGAASALFFIVTAVVLVCKVFSWQKNRTLDIQIKEG